MGARGASDRPKISDSSPPSGVRLSVPSVGAPPRPRGGSLASRAPMKSVPPAPLWPAPRRPLTPPVPPPSSPSAAAMERLPGRVVSPLPGAPQPPGGPAALAEPEAIPSPRPSKRKETVRSWPPTPPRPAEPAADDVRPEVTAVGDLAFELDDPSALATRRSSLPSVTDLLRRSIPELPAQALSRRRIAYGVMIVIGIVVVIELVALVLS